MPCSPCSLLSPALAANGRVALVVGNGAYRTVPALLNPVRDADAVARTLGEAGFEVLLATDLDLASLRERIYAFAAKVEAGGAEGTAVLFFAGHAVQLNGTNYLLPVDAQLMAAKDAPAQALALSDILKRLDSTRAGAKIVILDACRDNPFPSGSETGRGLALVGGTGGEGEAGEAGLARIESKGGTLVAFSTSPGATASDGEGASSPYAGALLDHMGESGLAVEAVFRRVRVAVQQATNREQTPWETSSLTREFTFFGAGPDPSAGAASSSFSRRAFEVSATRGVLARRSVDEAYEIAVHADTIEGYRAFLDVYSDDARALRLHRMVLLRLEETAWIEAVRAGDAASLAAFGRMFPGSHHTAEARRLLATAPARVVVQTASLVCPVLPVAPPAPPRPRAPTLLRRVRLEPAPAAEERSPARVSPARAAPPEPARVLPVRVRPEPVATPFRARLESPAIVPLRPRPEPKAEAPPNRGPTRAEPAAAEPVRGRAVHHVPVPVEVEIEELRRPPRFNVPGRLVRLPVIRRHVPRPHRPVVVVDPPGETRNPDRYDGGEPPVHGNPRFDGRPPGRMGVSDRFRPVRTFGGRFPGGGGPSPERFHGGGRSAPTRLAPIGPHEPRMHGPGHRRGAFLQRGFSPSGDFVGGMFLR